VPAALMWSDYGQRRDEATMRTVVDGGSEGRSRDGSDGGSEGVPTAASAAA
jgi:hypothetical protein